MISYVLCKELLGVLVSSHRSLLSLLNTNMLLVADMSHEKVLKTVISTDSS